MRNCSDFAMCFESKALALIYMGFLLQLRKVEEVGRLEGEGEEDYPHHFPDHLAERNIKQMLC